MRKDLKYKRIRKLKFKVEQRIKKQGAMNFANLFNPMTSHDELIIFNSITNFPYKDRSAKNYTMRLMKRCETNDRLISVIENKLK